MRGGGKMIDTGYLEKFGEERYKNFLIGEKVVQDKIFESPIDKIKMKFLKELEKSRSWSPFLYDLYYYCEMLHRIDFFSKYYFHSFVPKARNIDSVKVIFIRQGNMFLYNALNDTINIYRQDYFKGLEEERDYLILLNDNRKLQEYYGDFHIMLSLINTGHALYNLEYILSQYGIKYSRSKKGIFLKNERKFVDISIALEIDSQQKYYGGSKSIKEQEMANRFRQRSSGQNRGGDTIVREKMNSQQHESIISCLLHSNEKHERIRYWVYVDNIEGSQGGFYRIENNSLKSISGNERFIYEQMLYEYQKFTNLDGLNYWIFFSFNKMQKGFEELFIEMGYIAQEISVLVAKYNLAARGMKNYNDYVIKEKFGLNEDDIIGYSIVIFSNNNASHSIFLE